MAPRQEAEFPFKGRSDGSAKGKQPAGTTQAAKNVVGWVPGTEQMQGGQRAGLSPFLDDAVGDDNNPPLSLDGLGVGNPVQHGITVSYDRPAFDYTQRGHTLAAPGSNDLVDEWAHIAPNSAETTRVRVDLERNSYWLSGSLIVKRNADGESLFQVPIPVTLGQVVAPALELDLEGNLYTAASSGTAGEFCSVFKFLPRDDDKGMDLAWEVPVEADEIAAIAFEFGRLLIGTNSGGGTATRESIIHAIDDLDSDSPTVVLGLTAPYPIGDINAGPIGTYVTCPPDEERGYGDVGNGFADSEVDWTPHDLANSEQRLHFWVDANEVGQYADGARVTSWPDRRTVEPNATGSPHDVPHDDTQRDLVCWIDSDWVHQHTDGLPKGARPPKYRSNAAETLPGLVFNAQESVVNVNHSDLVISMDNGSAMYSRAPDLGPSFPMRDDKVGVAGKRPACAGLWPASLDQPWSFTFMFRWTPGWPPAVVWAGTMTHDHLTHGVTGTNWAIVTNFDAAAHIASTSTNSNFLRHDWVTPGNRFQLDGGIALIRNNMIVAYGTATSPTSEETNMAMLTVVRELNGTNDIIRLNGNPVGGGAQDVTLTTEWTDVANLNNELTDTNVTQPREVFGTRVWYEDQDLSSNTYYQLRKGSLNALTNFDSFTGSMHEIVSYYGTTVGGTAHDTNFGAAGGSDYEKVEGYLAWKWGVAANMLPVAHGYQLAAPTSGNGFTDVVENETSAALLSRDGILGRIKPNLEAFQWAIHGSGLGYGIATDDTNGLVCTGPRAANANQLTERGPRARILMKGIDRGLTFDWSEPATGRLTINSTPTDTTTFTLNDGTVIETYEFWDNTTSNYVGGNVLIDTQSNDADTIAGLIESAVTGHATQDIYAATPKDIDGYPQPIDLYSRRAPDGTERLIILTNVVGTEVVSPYGMTGPGAAPAGTWDLRVLPDFDVSNPSVQMDIDLDGAVYVPYTYSDGNKFNHIVKYSRGGELNGDNISTAKELWTHEVGGQPEAYSVHAVVVDPIEEDVLPATGPGSMWVASSNQDIINLAIDDEETQRRIELIKAVEFNGPARDTAVLAVAGGNLYKFNRGDAAPVLKAGGMLGSDSIWVQAAALFGEVFYVDAGIYKVYNLKKDTVRNWTVVGSGQMPEDARLLAAYRGRMVLARAKSDPHNIHASAQGDPYNWNLGAPTDDVTRAFSGSQSETARNPDIINAIAPFFDDRLVIGGDRTITVFSGDLSELGRADLFTDSTGMAYGATHALDPEGFIYFYGSRGGVWAMSPAAEGRSSPPVELTDQTIAAELGQLDLGIYRPHLVWDQEHRALYVYVVKRDGNAISQVVQQWMFEKRSKAWWPVIVDDATKQPTTAWLSDGDLPADRVHIIGCEDGRVRYWNPDAVWDDGTKIDSSVLIGPLLSQDAGFEAKLTSLEITLADGAVRYEVFASDTPASLGPVRASGKVTKGFSGSLRHKIRGGTLWIRLYNSSEAETWRLESVFADLYAGGRRRIR